MRARGRPADERHAGSTSPGGGRQGLTHVSRCAVTNVSDGVDRCPGGTCSDNDLAPFQALLLQQAPGNRKDLHGLRHSADADLSFRQLAHIRADHPEAELTERVHVALRRRVLPHPLVHGRAEQHRARRGEKSGRGQRVGLPRRKLGQKIRGCRRDDRDPGPASEVDVVERSFPQARADRSAGEPLERGSPHKPFGAPRQHDVDHGARLPQAAYEVGRLIGGDATGHHHENRAVVERTHCARR